MRFSSGTICSAIFLRHPSPPNIITNLRDFFSCTKPAIPAPSANLENRPMQSDARPTRRPCWCGNAELLPFSAHSAPCPVRETLVAQRGIPHDIPAVSDDEGGLYGKTYLINDLREDAG